MTLTDEMKKLLEEVKGFDLNLLYEASADNKILVHYLAPI